MPFFPLRARKDAVTKRTVAQFDPPEIPRLVAMMVELVGSRETAAIFSMDLPSKYRPTTRQQQELRDVETALKAGLQLEFENRDLKALASDPPDMEFQHRGGSWGIETAQIHMPLEVRGQFGSGVVAAVDVQ
jgi:hypothetical protein